MLMSRSLTGWRARPATCSTPTLASKSLADSWAVATTAYGRLMLTVLGGLAEFQREPRPGKGRKRAQERGVHPWGDRRSSGRTAAAITCRDAGRDADRYCPDVCSEPLDHLAALARQDASPQALARPLAPFLAAVPPGTPPQRP